MTSAYTHAYIELNIYTFYRNKSDSHTSVHLDLHPQTHATTNHKAWPAWQPKTNVIYSVIGGCTYEMQGSTPHITQIGKSRTKILNIEQIIQFYFGSYDRVIFHALKWPLSCPPVLVWWVKYSVRVRRIISQTIFCMQLHGLSFPWQAVNGSCSVGSGPRWLLQAVCWVRHNGHIHILTCICC